MPRNHLPVAWSLILCLLTSASQAAQNWQGAQIVPKSAQVSIQADNGSTTSMYDIAWPATVLRTRGRYLWIQDDGGYSRNQAGGWIYRDDALRLDEARDHFSNELRGGETAWLYWMRGICWESKGEPGVALIDYQSALRVDPATTIDDLQIRLGRIFAQEQFLGGQGKYRAALRSTWEDHFKSAKLINPSRPQLFYEWGVALAQACDCTSTEQQAIAERARAKAAKSDGATTASGTKAQGSKTASSVASRGLEPEDDAPAELPKPATQPKPVKTETNTAPTPATSSPSPAPAPAAAEQTAPAALPTVVRAAPTAAGAEAAVESLDDYVQAETLSPNWWRIPLARAELMLNQCDAESPIGERVAISPVEPKFFTQLLSHHHRGNLAVPSDIGVLPPQEVAMRGGEEITNAGSATASQPPPSALSPYSVAVLNTAIDDFNRAISLNSNALDAYRDRAEVLRLVNRLAEAQESATTACRLCYYRQARSLRTLAQIYKDNNHFQPAADYALRAAELTSGDEQQHFLQLWYAYSQLASGDSAKIAVASAQAGYVASRGVGSDDNSKPAQPPAHIDPPPGFLSRSGSAAE